ncbi:MAG: ribonuclease R family protein [Candidatus Cloacimonadaceae bacterium]
MRRNKLNLTTLETDIRNLFIQNSSQSFSIKDIIDALHLTPKSYKEVGNAVFALLENGFIRKENKKYILNAQKISTPKVNQPSPQLLQGTFDATPMARNCSYAFVRTEQGDFYVSAEDTLNAFHGDTVAIEPHYKNNKPDFCYIRKVIKRAAEILAGDLQQSNGKYYFLCSNPKIYQWFEVIDIGNAEPGMKVMLQVTIWGNRSLSKPPLGKVIEVLGPAGNPDTELLAVIRQNNLPLEFPEKVIDELSSLPETISNDELLGRKDLRNLITFTIDPASAKDYDDAISLEDIETGWRLYVHIADVSHYVKTDSMLFEECVTRGNSYYFPRKVIPMLPEKLSNRLCSLRQNEDKLTLSVITDFDRKGNILKQTLWESVINSDARLTYEQVDALYEDKESNLAEEIKKALNSGRELSRILSAKRDKDGCLFFDLPETEYIYDEEGFVSRMEQSAETEPHKLIENFMLVANQFIAEQLTLLAPFTIYRVHEFPDMEKLKRLSILLANYGLTLNFKVDLNHSLQRLMQSFPDEIYHKVFDKQVLRSLKKAKYSPQHLPHFGLAMETYTHFTSPIRRLCDLVIHHLCKQYILHSEQPCFNRKQITQYANQASDKELVADESERSIERVMNVIYMKNRVGEIYDGIITGMNSTSLFVQPTTLPITGVLSADLLPKGKWIYNEQAQRYQNERTADYYQLMDTVRVQVMQVTDDIYFELLNEAGSHLHHVSGLTRKVTMQKRNFRHQYKPGRKKRNGRRHR